MVEGKIDKKKKPNLSVSLTKGNIIKRTTNGIPIKFQNKLNKGNFKGL